MYATTAGPRAPDVTWLPEQERLWLNSDALPREPEES